MSSGIFLTFEVEREKMVEFLIRCGVLHRAEVIEAFERVPREEFVPTNLRKYAYQDTPLSIGHGQTISAPSMIAIMLESLDLEKGQKVLEIGTGSGYNAALLAEIVGKAGRVISIERIPAIAEFGKKNLKKTGYGNVKVVVGDGTCGYEEEAPWDRILITACSPSFPQPLLDQLKIGGKIGAPIGHVYSFQVWKVAKKVGESEVRIRDFTQCSFVPLVGMYGWKEE